MELKEHQRRLLLNMVNAELDDEYSLYNHSELKEVQEQLALLRVSSNLTTKEAIDYQIKAKRKDNPVPSLDLEHYKKFLIKRGFTNNGPIMYAHLNPLKAYLKKYGVEINDENKNNLVLSLNNFTKDELNCLLNVMGDEDVTDWLDSEKEYYSIMSKLENGVETNKKQLKNCNCHKSQCIMQNNVGKICTYKNVICDPEYFKG